MAEEAKKPEEDKVIVENKDETGADGADSVKKEAENEVETLKKKLAEANSRAAAAEIERDERKAAEETAKKEAKTNHDTALKAQEESIEHGVNAAKSNFEKAQQKLEEALDSGEKKAILAAQIELNDAQAGLRGAEYQKNSFEKWKEQNKNVATSAAATESGDYHNVRTASGQNLRLTKLERDFIVNKFPETLSDPEVEDALYDADRKAKRAGHKGGTQEYVDAVEAIMLKKGYGKTADADTSSNDKPKANGHDKKAEEARDKQQRFNASSTAAPARSGGGTASMTKGNDGNSKTTITLTPAQREAAQVCYPDLHRKNPQEAEEKYAKYLLQQQKGN